MIQFDEHMFQMGWFNHQLLMNMKRNDPFYSGATFVYEWNLHCHDNELRFTNEEVMYLASSLTKQGDLLCQMSSDQNPGYFRKKGIMLPSCIGISISQYKDPYQTVQWNVIRVLHVAHMFKQWR